MSVSPETIILCLRKAGKKIKERLMEVRTPEKNVFLELIKYGYYDLL